MNASTLVVEVRCGYPEHRGPCGRVVGEVHRVGDDLELRSTGKGWSSPGRRWMRDGYHLQPPCATHGVGGLVVSVATVTERVAEYDRLASAGRDPRPGKVFTAPHPGPWRQG